MGVVPIADLEPIVCPHLGQPVAKTGVYGRIYISPFCTLIVMPLPMRALQSLGSQKRIDVRTPVTGLPFHFV